MNLLKANIVKRCFMLNFSSVRESGWPFERLQSLPLVLTHLINKQAAINSQGDILTSLFIVGGAE